MATEAATVSAFLTVKVVAASGLALQAGRVFSTSTKPSPYVELSLLSLPDVQSTPEDAKVVEEWKTKVRKKTCSPTWDEVFTANVETQRHQFPFALRVRVLSLTRSKPGFVGGVSIPLDMLCDKDVDGWFPLEKEGPDDIVSGEIRMKLHVAFDQATKRAIDPALLGLDVKKSTSPDPVEKSPLIAIKKGIVPILTRSGTGYDLTLSPRGQTQSIIDVSDMEYVFEQPDDPSCVKFEGDTRSSSSLVAGTIPKVLEVLTSPDAMSGTATLRRWATKKESSKDFDEFLAVYPAWLSAEALLRLFVQRYLGDPRQATDRGYEASLGPIRSKVSGFMSLWLMDSQWRQDILTQPSLLIAVKRLGDTIWRHDLSLRGIISNVMAQKDRQGKDEGELSLAEDSNVSTTSLHDSVILAYGTNELAEQLTFIEAGLVRDINPRELLKQRWTKDVNNAPTVTTYVAHFNRITRWLMTEVMRGESAEERAVMVVKIIEIGQRCRELCNYNACMEVLSSLHSSPVARLKRTWGTIPKAALKTFEELTDLMNPKANFKNYRRIIEVDKLWVPYMGLHLTDLVYIDDANEDYVGPDKDLVNYEKVKLLAGVIRTVRGATALTYNSVHQLHRVRALISLLQRQDGWDDKELYRISKLREDPRSGSRIASPLKKVKRLKHIDSAAGAMMGARARGRRGGGGTASAADGEVELTEADWDTILTQCGWTPRYVPLGHVVKAPGDVNTSLYYVYSGAVCVVDVEGQGAALEEAKPEPLTHGVDAGTGGAGGDGSSDGDGGRIVSAGTCFGACSMLCPTRVTGRVTAAQEGTVLHEISAVELATFFTGNHGLCERFYRHCAAFLGRLISTTLAPASKQGGPCLSVAMACIPFELQSAAKHDAGDADAVNALPACLALPSTALLLRSFAGRFPPPLPTATATLVPGTLWVTSSHLGWTLQPPGTKGSRGTQGRTFDLTKVAGVSTTLDGHVKVTLVPRAYIRFALRNRADASAARALILMAQQCGAAVCAEAEHADNSAPPSPGTVAHDGDANIVGDVPVPPLIITPERRRSLADDVVMGPTRAGLSEDDAMASEDAASGDNVSATASSTSTVNSPCQSPCTTSRGLEGGQGSDLSRDQHAVGSMPDLRALAEGVSLTEEDKDSEVTPGRTKAPPTGLTPNGDSSGSTGTIPKSVSMTGDAPEWSLAESAANPVSTRPKSQGAGRGAGEATSSEDRDSAFPGIRLRYRDSVIGDMGGGGGSSSSGGDNLSLSSSSGRTALLSHKLAKKQRRRPKWGTLRGMRRRGGTMGNLSAPDLSRRPDEVPRPGSDGVLASGDVSGGARVGGKESRSSNGSEGGSGSRPARQRLFSVPALREPGSRNRRRDSLLAALTAAFTDGGSGSGGSSGGTSGGSGGGNESADAGNAKPVYKDMVLQVQPNLRVKLCMPGTKDEFMMQLTHVKGDLRSLNGAWSFSGRDAAVRMMQSPLARASSTLGKGKSAGVTIAEVTGPALSSSHRGLTQSDWNRLLKGAKQVPFEKDQVIIPHGRKYEKMYYVLSGSCRLEVASGQCVGRIAEGETFGELAFLSTGSRASFVARASVVAAEPVVLHIIEPYFANVLFSKYEGFAGRFFKYLSVLLAERWARIQHFRHAHGAIAPPAATQTMEDDNAVYARKPHSARTTSVSKKVSDPIPVSLVQWSVVEEDSVGKEFAVVEQVGSTSDEPPKRASSADAMYRRVTSPRHPDATSSGADSTTADASVGELSCVDDEDLEESSSSQEEDQVLLDGPPPATPDREQRKRLRQSTAFTRHAQHVFKGVVEGSPKVVSTTSPRGEHEGT